ncbi:hypothetical protein BT63DRAFT_121333 [Microthyrium microscopicum]|uniref:Serine/threonine-protein kinase ppk6 n=1 Tax=Microthyrium microscopicum TaxID=703497 RepID=A0A6A6TVP3_9PEZI|nr:hypothetical protein BT63DRAFT_121333 [Microthyrium microscopicum]
MSQDLFAAFATPTEPNSSEQPQQSTANAGSFSFFDDFANTSSTNQAVIPNVPIQSTVDKKVDDDWGDFEAPESVASPEPAAPAAPSKYHYSLDELTSPAPVHNSSGNKALDLLGLGFGESVKQKKFSDIKSPVKDPNVLFDANDDAEEDDDFGDFEEADFDKPAAPANPATKHSYQPKMPEIDLLGLDDPPQANSLVRQETVGRRHAGLKSPKKVVVKPAPVKKIQQQDIKPQEEEAWDEFTEWEQDNTALSKPSASTTTGDQSKPQDLSLLSGGTDPNTATGHEMPPTTIPPPALLLSIFPEIFERVEVELLKPASSLSQAERTHLYAESKTLEYLKGYLAILTVCARIIAGRKLRWKRDTLLAQSMRIGAASAGRMTGMKVTSLDKTEMTKEDGEVAEVLRIWAKQAGRIKSAVSEAKKTASSDLGVVPDMRDTMPVKSAKELDGGVPSVRPCALCGLKRDERVAKVDVDVMDYFGEWWIEQTSMHRACRNFWLEHEKSLRQR